MGDLDVVRGALKGQYHAALAMLRQAVVKCPEELWASGGYGGQTGQPNPFWRVAYHTLYFVHLYLMQTVKDFRAWEHHQTRIQDLDEWPAPPEIEDLCELPHRPVQTGVAYTKAQLLEYWDVCDGMVDARVDAMDLYTRESGFPWYTKFGSKLEHQMLSIRHIQGHMAQLGERLKGAGVGGIDWVGTAKERGKS